MGPYVETMMENRHASWRSMRIKCAAIRYEGEIYEGLSHCEIGLRMIREGICDPPYPHGDDQGFVTECGIYVRRAPAMAIARNAGQVEKGKTIHPRELFSEDLRERRGEG